MYIWRNSLEEGTRRNKKKNRKHIQVIKKTGNVKCEAHGRIKHVKADVIEIEGVVVEKLPNAMFKLSWRTDTLFWRISAENCV